MTVQIECRKRYTRPTSITSDLKEKVIFLFLDLQHVLCFPSGLENEIAFSVVLKEMKKRNLTIIENSSIKSCWYMWKTLSWSVLQLVQSNWELLCSYAWTFTLISWHQNEDTSNNATRYVVTSDHFLHFRFENLVSRWRNFVDSYGHWNSKILCVCANL